MLASTNSHAQFVRELRSLLRAPYPLLHVETFEERRAVELIARLSDEEGRPVERWTPVDGFAGRDGSCVREDLEYAANADRPAIFVFLGGHRVFDDPLDRRRLFEIAASDETDQSLVFVSPLAIEAPELDKDLTSLSMPLPTREILDRECERVFGKGEYPDIDRERMIAGALGLTGREAHRAFERVCRQYEEALEQNALFDPEQAILREKQRMIGESEVLEYHGLEYGLDDVGGLDLLKEWLEERRRAFSERARTFGLPLPKGLLLIGVQGCGKSLTAKAVARHWNLPLLRLDLGAIFDGQRSPDQALRSALETCEAIAPSVLWIDEIEKGFAGERKGRSDRVLGSLLTWQQEKREPVFLVATANEVDALPPELMRKGRFDEIFFIDLPGLHERREILEIHLNRRGRSFPTEFVRELAIQAEYFSGAELEQVVVSAMYTAFADDREVEREDLSYACNEMVPLYRTYEDRIKALREWAHGRARPASQERELLDFFE